MPMGSGVVWLAAGVTAAMGAAAYVLWRNRTSRGNAGTQVLKTNQVESAAPGSSSSRGFKIPSLRKLIRERKMVFVVNRPLLSNKQILFVAVSTACLRYYRSIMKNQDYMKTHVKPWTRTGQMKVVLKANNGDELQSILDRCQEEGVEAILLNVGDLGSQIAADIEKDKKKGKKSGASVENYDPKTPVILCVLAPTEKLDQITGHLKLL